MKASAAVHASSKSTNHGTTACSSCPSLKLAQDASLTLAAATTQMLAAPTETLSTLSSWTSWDPASLVWSNPSNSVSASTEKQESEVALKMTSEGKEAQEEKLKINNQ